MTTASGVVPVASGVPDTNGSTVSGRGGHEENISRVILDGDPDHVTFTNAEWLDRWRQQEKYVLVLEQRLTRTEEELTSTKQRDERNRTELQKAQQRERNLMRRLLAKEDQYQDVACQLRELKESIATETCSRRARWLDPAVNCMVLRLRDEVQTLRSQLEDAQNELSAWKFTPDSNTGKRLMAKCRLLYQENEELGRMCSSGRVAKLETELALHKSFADELKQSQNELDGFLADLDEDVEGMQSTILYLQQELRKSRDDIKQLQEDTVPSPCLNGGDTVVAVNRCDSNMSSSTTTSPPSVLRSNSVTTSIVMEVDVVDQEPSEQHPKRSRSNTPICDQHAIINRTTTDGVADSDTSVVLCKLNSNHDEEFVLLGGRTKRLRLCSADSDDHHSVTVKECTDADKRDQQIATIKKCNVDVEGSELSALNLTTAAILTNGEVTLGPPKGGNNASCTTNAELL